MVKPEKGLFVDIEDMIRRDAKDLADSLTLEAERIGAEDDPEFAARLENLACKLDDAFGQG